MAEAISDLEGLRAHWGLDRWIVAGHSWGASLALGYALTHPERTQGLMHLSGTGVTPAWHSAYYAERDRLLGPDGQQALTQLENQWLQTGTLTSEQAYCQAAWQTDFADLTHGYELARTLLVGDLRINTTVNRLLWADARHVVEQTGWADRLPTLDVPTLVVHGAADPRPAAAASDVAWRLPQAECVVIEGAGHLPWVERPGELGQVLNAFLHTLASSPSPAPVRTSSPTTC